MPDPPLDRLLLDVMLGKLATYLRMCGYDAAYALDRGIESDERLLAVAAEEDRLLLTRDVQLAESTENSHLLRSREVEDQLRELRGAGFDLRLAEPPARCGQCNGPVEQVGDEEHREATDRPDYVPDDGPVWRCRDCGQYFWKGSHWDDVRERLDGLDETE